MKTIETRPATFTLLLANALVWIAAYVGLNLDITTALLFVVVGTGFVSYFAPRELGIARPVGLATAASGVIVWIAVQLGVTLSPEQATLIVTVIGTFVGRLTPRETPIEGELDESGAP